MLVIADLSNSENKANMSQEIFDLIAKVSWETNEKALNTITKDLKGQDKLLEELRAKGSRLNDQLIKTNDPKKVKSLNDELQKTKKSVDSIIDSQKKQATALDSLNKKQTDLISKLKQANDPKLVQGLLRNLKQVENQMSALDKQATSLPSKIGGIGKSLLEGFGIGAGMFGLQAALSGIQSFVGGSIAEFEDAQKTALYLQRALKVIGKDKYFEGLKNEADQLAEKFHGLFDNDEIIKAQTALVQYGKVSREEISKLLPVILNLAAAEGIDLVQASEKVVNILEGRGGQTLRDYGVTVKGVKTEHDRLNVILGDFQTKLTGAADTYSTTAKGIEQTNKVLIQNIEENFGASFSRLKGHILPVITDILNGINDFLEWKIDLSPQSLKDLRARESFNKGLSILKSAKADADINKALNPNAGSDEATSDATVKATTKKLQKAADKKENKVNIRFKLDNSLPGDAPDSFKFADSLKGDKANTPEALAAFEKDLGIYSEAYKGNLQEEIDATKKAEKEKTALRRKEAKERAAIARQELFDQTMVFASQLSDLYGSEIKAIDSVISAQERRVEAAKNASDASLRIEQNRLDQLTAKREKYERRQRTIEAAVIVANQILAISYAVKGIAKAASEGGAGAAFTVAANVLAIGGGVLAAVEAIKSVDRGFKDGGYTGDGDPSATSTTLGNRGYKYHKKEFVMNESLTTKHRDMLEGMHKGELMVNKMNDGYYLTNRTIDTDKAVADYYSVKNNTEITGLQGLLTSIDTKLSQREVRMTNNFDAQGFGQAVATQLGRVSIINKMRG
jgi:hypothetical protein